DGDTFRLAKDLDPQYADAFDKALQAGVETYALRCDVSSDGIEAMDLITVEK
ncbi:MAG: DNA/RNA nuclease SfsA, partial [Pseudomonadota bacterium]